MQVVDYETDAGDGHAGLLVSDGPDGAVRFESLAPGATISYALGDRHCAGALDEGRHVPCEATGAPRCPDHRSTWICARCTGTCLKSEMDCHEPHAVYLAAFAPRTFKVGVTRLWRLEQRLREQGADRAAHVHTVADGRVAREIESEIAERVPDRVRVDQKLAGLHRTVDDGAWATLLDEFDAVDTYDLAYGLDLERRPVAETLATGRVRGTKGRLLLLDRSGTTYAVDLRDLVGYEIEAGGTDRDLQANLGAFG